MIYEIEEIVEDSEIPVLRGQPSGAPAAQAYRRRRDNFGLFGRFEPCLYLVCTHFARVQAPRSGAFREIWAPISMHRKIV